MIALLFQEFMKLNLENRNLQEVVKDGSVQFKKSADKFLKSNFRFRDGIILNREMHGLSICIIWDSFCTVILKYTVLLWLKFAIIWHHFMYLFFC
ncbi:hypothetical protein ES288_D13G021500v1 [Gossypium darwinii]|uniref:Uncharacterized protein n=1 Tax=Gossypium darwinii TaxID=34276 RepID=A0A5D1ZUT2_GOSDA|nr:hypothetical protein ES288_D13G021500v1 [Gossypium darwinii]